MTKEDVKNMFSEDATPNTAISLVDTDTGSDAVTWQLVAQTADRVLFTLFSCVIVIATAVVFPIIVNGGRYPNVRSEFRTVACDALPAPWYSTDYD